MHFAAPLPVWAIPVVAAAVVGLAYYAYRRPLVPLTVVQRGILSTLRGLTLASLVVFLCRPIVLLPPASAPDAVVPVLVDVSRSMRVADMDGKSRLTAARDALKSILLPALSGPFTPEIYAVGDALTPSTEDALTADARQTDLVGALAAVRERYRGRNVPGVVLFSDGGDTGLSQPVPAGATDLPVFAVGVGTAAGRRDREVLGLAAGEARLGQSTVDLHVSAVSYGFEKAPFQLRLLANGQLVESRRMVPTSAGAPVDALFTVSPDPLTATVYTAEIPTDTGEPISENNTRSVHVDPAGRRRRVLILEGAPGYEHAFLTRALSRDTGLEVDSVVRKGRGDSGQDTYFIQAGAGRATVLSTGFPSRREALYAYDAVAVANVEGDTFTTAQLAMLADYVGERGGGLIVFGGRSFAQRGLSGTPLEEALPVELTDRRGGAVRASLAEGDAPPVSGLALTTDGERHPATRIGTSIDDTRKAWEALPPLAATVPLGAPRPGASVLVVSPTPSGLQPVIAVQRYGRGRSMVFAGEGSWRWRMLLPSTDQSYEHFWRQTFRWLSTSAPDPVTITVPESAEPGDAVTLGVDVRDEGFAPVPDAAVTVTLTQPGGEIPSLPVRREAGANGRYVSTLRVDQVGLYRAHVEARRNGQSLGSADRWFYVGGSDREFSDPRLNEGFLRRLSRQSGGHYVAVAQAADVVPSLKTSIPRNIQPERRDLWHLPWVYAMLLTLMGAEWVVRRRWGLR